MVNVDNGTVEWSDIEQYASERDASGDLWACRKGKVRLADGSEHHALLDFCESDSNEHYGTRILIADPEAFDPGDESFAKQGDSDFLAKLGRTKGEVFPYTYKYEGPECDDHHVGSDGWSH